MSAAVLRTPCTLPVWTLLPVLFCPYTWDLAAKVQCPVALLPAKGDPMESLKEVRACVPVFEGGWMGVRFLAG
eukprot:scaffold148838_cov17-Tisochrysis_lutea.AAC.2